MGCNLFMVRTSICRFSVKVAKTNVPYPRFCVAWRAHKRGRGTAFERKPIFSFLQCIDEHYAMELLKRYKDWIYDWDHSVPFFCFSFSSLATFPGQTRVLFKTPPVRLRMIKSPQGAPAQYSAHKPPFLSCSPGSSVVLRIPI